MTSSRLVLLVWSGLVLPPAIASDDETALPSMVVTATQSDKALASVSVVYLRGVPAYGPRCCLLQTLLIRQRMDLFGAQLFDFLAVSPQYFIAGRMAEAYPAGHSSVV